MMRTSPSRSVWFGTRSTRLDAERVLGQHGRMVGTVASPDGVDVAIAVEVEPHGVELGPRNVSAERDREIAAQGGVRPPQGAN
jgi:hypothetical protein